MLLALEENECLFAGELGPIQRRRILAYDTETASVRVDEPFEPPLRSGQPWRLAEEFHRLLPANVQGITRRFVWDSADAQGSLVFLRGMARDDEVGLAEDGTAPKRARGALEVEPLVLGSGFGSAPASVVAADLDGDGDLDLAYAYGNRDNLTVFFQLASGTFAATPLVLGGSDTMIAPRSVSAADLDGDGDLDLVSANERSSNLTVFFQESPGNFAATPLVLGGFTTTVEPNSVTAADLDGDGDLDLVSANNGSNDLTIFSQLAPGSFAAAPLVVGGPGMTGGPNSVVAADLDGDGDLDLASANYRKSGTLTVSFQLAPGSFAPTPLLIGDIGDSFGPDSVAAADLDGDGDQDLVSASRERVVVFFQLAPGSFTVDPIVLGGTGTQGFFNSVIAADIDGDKDLDLVSADYVSRRLAVFFQLAPGRFGTTPLVLGLGTTRSPFSVAADDLDGNGSMDLVSANSRGDLTALFQQAAGNFTAAPLVLGDILTSFAPASVAAGDLDGDGDLDLVSANEFSGLAVFSQLAPGRFGSTPLVLGGGLLSGPASVTAADLDGDGDLDLASANYGVSNVTVFFRLSSGSFTAEPLVLGNLLIGSSRGSIAAADLDGDSDLDLVATNSVGYQLAVFFQIAPGLFATAPLVLGDHGTGLPSSLAAADLDGDGDQDLVSTNYNQGNLTVYHQLEPGSFAATPFVLGTGTTQGPLGVRRATSTATATRISSRRTPSGMTWRSSSRTTGASRTLPSSSAASRRRTARAGSQRLTSTATATWISPRRTTETSSPGAAIP